MSDEHIKNIRFCADGLYVVKPDYHTALHDAADAFAALKQEHEDLKTFLRCTEYSIGSILNSSGQEN